MTYGVFMSSASRVVECSAVAALWIFAVLFSPFSALSDELPEVGSSPPWTRLSESDDPASGYMLYRRATPDSEASTFRLEAIVDSPPDLVARAAARFIADPEYRQANTDKEVLQDDDEAIVLYNYIHINAPFVSDRDVISRIEKSYDPGSKVHRLVWRAVNEGGPPKKEDVIRLERSDGSWTFSPEADGTTRAVYTSHTEIAGFLPAWIVDSQMSKTMIEGIENLRLAVERERQVD